MGSVEPAHHPPVAFPEADWQWFLARCAALAISDPTPHRSVLEALYGHLIGVNRWLNLTTLVAARDYLKGHVLDSLSLEGDSRVKHLSEGAPCVDLGSGGGYPGLPLAVWHPTIRWVLVDARRKKADFLAAAADLVGPQVSARHLRGGQVVHDAADLQRRCQLVVCRAMGTASEVLTESARLVQPHGHLVIYKGPAFVGEERDQAIKTASVLGFRALQERLVRLEEGDPERYLVIYQRLR